MTEFFAVPISPWYGIPAGVGILVLTFAFLPGMLLHLGVLIYPKNHDRRREFIAELYEVPFLKRPFWVAGVLVRCAFEGIPERLRPALARYEVVAIYVPNFSSGNRWSSGPMSRRRARELRDYLNRNMKADKDVRIELVPWQSS